MGRVAANGTTQKTLYDLEKAVRESDDRIAVLENWERNEVDSRSTPLKGLNITIDGAHTPSGNFSAQVFEGLGANVNLIRGDVKE